MFYLIRFFIVWTIWFILADKSRWREIVPVCLLASLLGAILDNVMGFYELWHYHSFKLPDNLLNIFNDLDMFIVVPYLFIQWLPKDKPIKNMLWYWFIWTGIAITIEYIHVHTGRMIYHKWWNIYFSYAADWFLLYLFYNFHKVLNINKTKL